ncbi:MAG: GIY-YIG nuclease family protein [Nitrososphaerales archaeon]
MRRRHHVYILSCRNDYLYTGYTISLRRRLSQHKKGIGSKFTRSHLPVRLVYSESYSSRSEALKREIAIKRLPRSKKVLLISNRRFSKVQ